MEIKFDIFFSFQTTVMTNVIHTS